MASLLDRITIDPKQCGGRACVRGMRIRVSDVLDLFAAGLNAAQILEEMPDLQPEDLDACIADGGRLDELRRRKEEFMRNPESGCSWEEVKRQARNDVG